MAQWQGRSLMKWALSARPMWTSPVRYWRREGPNWQQPAPAGLRCPTSLLSSGCTSGTRIVATVQLGVGSLTGTDIQTAITPSLSGAPQQQRCASQTFRIVRYLAAQNTRDR
jgi:hypothetical protein